jgi:hypothetical protein
MSGPPKETLRPGRDAGYGADEKPAPKKTTKAKPKAEPSTEE